MRTVHVGIRHDNNLVITQLLQIKRALSITIPDAGAARASKARFASGRWKLAALYVALEAPKAMLPRKTGPPTSRR